MNENIDKFLTPNQASKLLGLSPQTLKLYRLSGELTQGKQWFRINSRVVRYSEQGLLSWMQSLQA